ncbi:MAG: ATP-binding protein [Bacteroidales bacterium]
MSGTHLLSNSVLLKMLQTAQLGYMIIDLCENYIFISDYIKNQFDLKNNTLSFPEFRDMISPKFQEQFDLLIEQLGNSADADLSASFPLAIDKTQWNLYLKFEKQNADNLKFPGLAHLAGISSEEKNPDTGIFSAPVWFESNLCQTDNNSGMTTEKNEVLCYPCLSTFMEAIVPSFKNGKEYPGSAKVLSEIIRKTSLCDCMLTLSKNSDGALADYEISETNQLADEIFERFSFRKRYFIRENKIKDLPVIQYFITAVEQDGLMAKEHYQLPGDNHYYTIFIYPVSDDKLRILFKDTTENLYIEEELDRSQQTFRKVLRSIPVGVSLFDAKGKLIDLNEKEMELFNIKDKRDVMGRNMFDCHKITGSFKERLLNGEKISMQVWLNDKRTSPYKFILKKAIPIFDEEQQLMNYVVINIDQTEKELATSRIEDFEHLFSSIGSFAKVGYVKWNMKTKEGFAIDQWYRNLGASKDMPLDQIIGVFPSMHPDDRKAMQAYYTEMYQGTRKSCTRQNRMLTKEHTIRWIHNHVMVTRYAPEEGVVQLIGINIDITDFKNNELSLIREKEKAENLDKLKSAFIANMSHEIRTPLNAIVGFSNLLIATRDKDEQAAYISIIEDNNDLLLQLIEDIMDLSQIESNNVPLHYEMVEIKPLCQELISIFAHKSKESLIITEAPDLSDITFYTDKTRINQVLSNLLNNAVKFTNKGVITAGYRVVSKDQIEFFVEDTGKGIKSEHIPQLFNRFYKVDEFVPGNGLGLSICQDIIRQMDGELGVSSIYGKGSRFHFTLPYLEKGNLNHPYVLADTENLCEN